MHYAKRDRSNKNILRKEQDITINRIKEAQLLAEKLKQINVATIYTFQYFHCKHTAEIINKYNNALILEEGFNEMGLEES